MSNVQDRDRTEYSFHFTILTIVLSAWLVLIYIIIVTNHNSYNVLVITIGAATICY